MATSNDILDQAVRLHQEGRFSEAFPLYFQALNDQPDDAAVWHLAGLASFQAGCSDLAENALLKAISIDSSTPNYHIHLAAVLAGQGRVVEATTSLRRALHLDPNNTDALFNLGNALVHTGDIAGGTEFYLKARATEPRSPDIHHNLGAAYTSLGKESEALESFRNALALDPTNAATHSNAGMILLRQGNPRAALAHFRNAIALDPTNENARLGEVRGLVRLGQFHDAESALLRSLAVLPNSGQLASEWTGLLLKQNRASEAEAAARQFAAFRPDDPAGFVNLSAAMREQGNFVGAAKAARQAIALDPHCEPARINLAVAHLDGGEWDEAATACQAVLELNDRNADAWFTLGAARHRSGKLEQAGQAYAKASSLDPTRLEAWCNHGAVLRDLGKTEEAIRCYNRALSIEPHFALARFNRACAQLTMGHWKEGWADYEARWEVPGLLPPVRAVSSSRWNGESLEGKSLLVLAEQGFGDTIQFVRYLQSTAELGARVILEAPPALASLLSSAPGIHQVVGSTDPLPETDYHIPLLSLPRLVSENADQSKFAFPYLAPSGNHWNPPNPRTHKLRVGLVWTGNPSQKDNLSRSIPWPGLAPLLRVGNIDWISLQTGPNAQDFKNDPLWRKVEDWGSLFRDFQDTASALLQLDLLITVCTASAHLAGAMNLPVWALLSHAPCWRWGNSGSSTPWYPSMRLFRQPELGNWDAVISSVRDEILRLRDGRS